MIPGFLTDPFPLVVIGIAIAVLAWDVSMAGWISARREAPRIFIQLTVVCGLLVVPVLVINIASGTESGARTISGITWLVPAVTVAFALQVLYAVVGRLVSPLVGVPILLYDVMLATIAVGDYLVTQRGAAPLPLQAALAARDAIVGMGVGRAALVSPLTALVPMVAPAYPARWRLSGAVRAGLVLAATALTTLLGIEWPRGVAAVRSYAPALSEPMQARPRGDFVIGVRLYPALDGLPPARAVRNDATIVEAFDPDVVLLVLEGDGTRGAVLDSLARVLAPLRERETQIAVALRLDRHPAGAADADRQLAIERVLQRLEPDVLFPALADAVPSWLGAEAPSPWWWRTMLTTSARTVQRVRPRTLLAWSATRLDATDSATYAWASHPSSGVRLLGATVFPSFSGLPAVDARLRAFERWHNLAAATGPLTAVHWLVNVGGLPRAHGDAAQVAAIRRALAWGSRRSWVSAAIVGEPADYDGWLGLRASNGRARAALSVIGTSAKRMKDVRAGN